MADQIAVFRGGKKPEKPLFPSAVIVDGWVYVSGQGPLKDGKVNLGSIADQTRLTLENIDAILREAGVSRADVIKCTCYLTDTDDYAEFNEAYRQFFDVPVMPARTTVYCRLNFGIGVEIDAVARLPK